MKNQSHDQIVKTLSAPGIQFAYIDLFCGAGGTSTGVNETEVARVIACVNHDATAIASHAANHPDALHFIEDIRTLSLTGIASLVGRIRRDLPQIKIILWASLECTNFSKAKGGLPRDPDSRTLAEHLYRYIEILDPDYIQIENVVEFMAWGPLDENNKPVSRKNGQYWIRWRTEVNAHGYYDDWRELNAANYGAYTSRNRLFGIFAKKHLPISWPTPTHSKHANKPNLFTKGFEKWKPVRECLDFSKEGESIFTRKKPLVEATLERIYAGLVKFVAKGDDSFIQKFFSGKPMGKVTGMDAPLGTITGAANQALVNVFLMQSNGGLPSAKVSDAEAPSRVITSSDNKSAVFLTKYNSSHASGKVSPGQSIEDPCHTVAVQQRLAVTSAELLTKYYGAGGQLSSMEDPAGVVTTKDRMSVGFIDQQYGRSIPASVDDPAGTLTANPKLAACFIDRPFTQGGGKHVSIDGPMGTLTTVLKANLVECERWILTNSFEKSGTSIEDPSPTILATGMTKYLISSNFKGIARSMEDSSPTITANRKHHYLINPQFTSKGGDIDNPAFTLIARMDKMPPYLATAETGEAAILIYESDSVAMKKIKVFMACYGIVDHQNADADGSRITQNSGVSGRLHTQGYAYRTEKAHW